MTDLKGYMFEISHIINELGNIERGLFYEVDRTPGTASARTIAKNVRETFEDLIMRIHEGKPGKMEEVFKKSNLKYIYIVRNMFR